MGAPDNVRHQGKSPALSVSERKLRTQDLPEEVGFPMIAISYFPLASVAFVYARSQQCLIPAMVTTWRASCRCCPPYCSFQVVSPG